MRGDTAGGRARLEEALDLALRKGLTSAAAETYRLLGTVAEYASCYGDEQEAFSRALAYCRRHDETNTADLCRGCLSYSLFRSGHWVKAEKMALAVRRRGEAVSGCVAEGVLGLLHAHRGEAREATACLEASREAARKMGILAMEFFCGWGLGLVEEQAGRPESAGMHYRDLLRFWAETEDRHDAIPGLAAGALFFLDRGMGRDAAGFEAALRKIVAEAPNPEARGAVALVEGERLRQEGKAAEAVRLAGAAAEEFARRELEPERVQALWRLAAARRAAGDEPAARAAWREAGRRARRLGLRGLLAAAEARLERAGARAETRETTEPDSWSGLSPRQREVARILATGATNKEIASRLGIGVRTVDMHVAHLLARLECRGRAEAAARIATWLA